MTPNTPRARGSACTALVKYEPFRIQFARCKMERRLVRHRVVVRGVIDPPTMAMRFVIAVLEQVCEPWYRCPLCGRRRRLCQCKN